MIVFTIPVLSQGMQIDLFAVLFLALFWGVGIFILIKGLQKVITNHRTSKLGEECFGQINNCYPTGNRMNGMPEYAIEALVYIPSKNKMENIKETIGFNASKYPIYSFVKCKYYNGDINILKKVNEAQLPLNIKSYFEPYMNNSNSTVDDIITVNGIRYKRIDDENNQNK